MIDTLTDTILDELVNFSVAYDRFQTKTDIAHITDVFRVLLEKRRILISYRTEVGIAGYAEVWRITADQFGRRLLNIPVNIEAEDIETGPVCYLANITIHPHYRNTQVIKELAEAFREQNRDASYFVGHAQRKTTGLIKVFDVDKLEAVIGGAFNVR